MFKKFIIGIISFFLINIFIIMAFSFNVKLIVEDLIVSSGFEDRINEVIGICFQKKNINIIKKEDITELLDQLSDSVVAGDDSSVNDLLVKLINKKRKELRKLNISDNKINAIIYGIEAGVTISVNNFEFTDQQKFGLIMYKYITNSSLKKWSIIISSILIFLLIIIDKLKAIRDVGINLIGAAILIKCGCFTLIEFMNTSSYKKTMGNIVLNLSYFNKFIYIYAIIGILLFIIYVIMFSLKDKNNFIEKHL